MILIDSLKDFKELNLGTEALDCFMKKLGYLCQDILENREYYEDFFEEHSSKDLTPERFKFSNLSLEFKYYERIEEIPEELKTGYEEKLNINGFTILTFTNESIMYRD